MPSIKPIALSIAGFDPSAGAGLLADIKVMEQLGVYGMGIMTANTIQHEAKVVDVMWMPADYIISQLEVILYNYSIETVKIGIVQNSSILSNIIASLVGHNSKVKIIWDPILKSSSGYDFFEDKEDIYSLLEDLYVITPNQPEFDQLFTKQEAPQISGKCAIYLKGGHSMTDPGTDVLYHEGKTKTLPATNTNLPSKHGSGCVLSTAITAYLTKGEDLTSACQHAKTYIEKFLTSHPSLLGWHKQGGLL